MDTTCSTRALKNAKFIRATATGVIPAEEPIEGFHSIVPFEVLNSFGRMSEADLTGFPQLLDAWRQLRQPRPALFGDPPFKGTLHFVQLTFFFTGGGSTTINRGDVATAIEYATLAAPVISAYCQQYGSNSLEVSPEIIQGGITLTRPVYNDDKVQEIVNDIMAQNHQLDADSTCIVLINPHGLTNTDADPSQGVLGYHDKADVPYCFINVSGPGPLTVADRGMRYAEPLSHEIAEMTCDPDSSIFNDEVCDGCAGGCHNQWQNYFTDPAPSLANAYLRSAQSPPSLAYSYFTASVAQRKHADDCPAPQNACAYPPPMPVGRSTLLFYDRGAGTGEFYAVDGAAEIDVQYSHTDWNHDWTHIVPGNFTGRPHTDLLFYAADTGTGAFFQTDGAGGMTAVANHTDWNHDWTHIVPGNFTGGPHTDLLFYAADTGTGAFFQTDGAGGMTAVANHTDWNHDWTHIVPGNFTGGPHTDLLFYAADTGTGAFFQTDGAGGMTAVANHTDWNHDWTHIVPGNFTGGPHTDLLFYAADTGTGAFFQTDGAGGMTAVANHTDWNHDWTHIVPGNFTGGPHTDLLFYAADTGTGGFARSDGNGAVSSVNTYNNWRGSWAAILQI